MIEGVEEGSASDFPTYQWRVLVGSGVLEIAGPLDRIASRRRTCRIDMRRLAGESRAFVDPSAPVMGPIPGSSRIRAGKRQLLVFGEAGGSGYLVDLTRGLRRRARLAEFASRLEEGINALPEAFVLYDEHDRLIVANPQYTALYPAIADKVRPGITFSEICRAAVERGQFRIERPAQEWLCDRIGFHFRGEGYFEQQLDDGRWIRVSERRTPSGGTTSIRSDVTLLKQQQQELHEAMVAAEESSRSISRFLAVLSHEVRNGLNGILGMAQLLADDEANCERTQKWRAVVESTRGLVTILADLLEYLKNEARGVSIHLQPIDARSLLPDLCATFSTSAHERGMAIRGTVDASIPPWIEGDPARIQQVLVNLVSNALKYSCATEVVVSAAACDGRLRFEVRDDGVGIPCDQVGELFELFSRAGQGDNRRGTGLGLAISRQLVTAMDGVIDVESEPDRGARFWFDLPLVEAPAPSPSKSQAPVCPGGAGRRLRIGVVDDDPLNRYVAEHMLRRLGHEVVVFDTGTGVLEGVHRHRLDALVLDIAMPGESGARIAARVRTEGGPRGRSMAIVAATGAVLPEGLRQFLDNGFDAVLRKPIFIDELDRVLQRAGIPDAVPAGLEQPAVADPRTVLSRLRVDMGKERFQSSVRSAHGLYQGLQAALAADASPEDLHDLLHQVAGNGPALGFVRLGEVAAELDAVIRQPSGWGDLRWEGRYRDLAPLLRETLVEACHWLEGEVDTDTVEPRGDSPGAGEVA